MLAEFTIIPIGKGESMGEDIARVMKIVSESGIPYKANAMGTILEGEWAVVMEVIKKCHDEVIKTAPRLVSSIQIDMRPGKPLDRLEEKLRSVEKRLGKKIKT